jgi:Mannosyltransferase OCH1 and related enzymes
VIPRIIHYCWFGRGPMPELALKCIDSWHKYMPGYEYRLWNEDSFDVNRMPYTSEAYQAHKYAFVSDVVRLKALSEHGGIYFDVDFEVYKSFDDLLDYHAFAGFEGSKYNPVMMGVLGSEPGGEWVTDQLRAYSGRHFIQDGKEDLTTNVMFVTERMMKEGFVPDGREQDFKDLHVFPVDYFCPRLTSGEYLRTENTYCESKGGSSWAPTTFKGRLLSLFSPEIRTGLIKLKRRIIG